MNPLDQIKIKQQQLQSHPVFHTARLKTLDEVRVYMEYHVYAVWDFMSLLKALQEHAAPSGGVWTPPSVSRRVSRLINEIVLGEETDVAPGGTYLSHFELYLEAMREVGANTEHVTKLIDRLRTDKKSSLNAMLTHIPKPCQDFCNTTFEFIASNKPHVIAAAFAYGRELIIPGLFTDILKQLDTEGVQAPTFRYYLERHVQLDRDEHGPAAEELVVELCEGNPMMLQEAHAAASSALEARLDLWVSIFDIINKINHIRRWGISA